MKKKNIPVEFVFQLFALIIAIIIVHAFYVSVVRPNAAEIIAEQNMMGVAAGMASCGLIPWLSSFAVFLVNRDLDHPDNAIVMNMVIEIAGQPDQIPRAQPVLRERAADVELLRGDAH